MAIFLPPPIEPQLAPLAELRAAAKVRVDIGPAVFYVADRCGLGTDGIRTAALAAKTPSDFVRGLGDACYAAGYPAERTAYAVDGATLYISVDQGRIAEISVPEHLKAFFGGLTTARVTHQSDLEIRRALADSLSERGGENYVMRLEPIGRDAARMVIGTPTPGRNQSQALAGFSTSGNRYSGRYLADAQLRHSWSFGTEVTLGGVIGVRPEALRDSSSGPYHEGSAGLSQITSAGVFGIDGRYVEYTPIVPTAEPNGNPITIRLDGRIREGGVSWLTPLYATYNQRVGLSLRVAREEQTLDFRSPSPELASQSLLTERYTKANAVLTTLSRFVIGNSNVFEFQSGLDLGHGFTESAFGAGDNARGSYSLARPALRLSYAPGAAWSPMIEASAQFASAAVPQLEQYVLGGASLRAFEPGSASGDQGYGGRFAFEHAWLGWDWFSIKPTVFAEYGATRLRDSAAAPSTGTARRADVGFEAAMRLGSHIELTGYAAESIARSGPSALPNDEHRLGARLSLSF